MNLYTSLVVIFLIGIFLLFSGKERTMGALSLCFVFGTILFLIFAKIIKGSEKKTKNMVAGRADHQKKPPAAVEEYLNDIWAEEWPHEGGQLSVHDLSAGFAYSLFGLPDGTHAPQNALAAPGPETLKRALERAIIPTLKRKEKRLVNTPLVFARVPFIDAAHVFDEEGGSWIVLNHALFGALYSVNDRFLEILEVNSGSRNTDDPIKIACRLPDLMRRFVLGERICEEEWLVRMTTRMDPKIRYLIETYTSVQQIFFVLHELGHSYLAHGVENAVQFGAGLSVWRSLDSNQKLEKAADSFAADHLRKGPLPDRLAGNPEACITGLFLLFECLELLRKIKKYSPGSHSLPRERFKRLARSISRRAYMKLHGNLSGKQSLFDDVYTVWELNN